MERHNSNQPLDASLLGFGVSEFSSNAGSLTKRQFAMCGAVAGAIASSCTTPMDVAKTRIMLAEVSNLFPFLFQKHFCMEDNIKHPVLDVSMSHLFFRCEFKVIIYECTMNV